MLVFRHRITSLTDTESVTEVYLGLFQKSMIGRFFVKIVDGCAFPCVEIFNFVEIHSAYCLYL